MNAVPGTDWCRRGPDDFVRKCSLPGGVIVESHDQRDDTCNIGVWLNTSRESFATNVQAFLGWPLHWRPMGVEKYHVSKGATLGTRYCVRFKVFGNVSRISLEHIETYIALFV